MTVKLSRGESWKNKVKLDLTGLDMLQKRLEDFATKKIMWGYFNAKYVGDGPDDKRHGLPVALIAMWHEYRKAAGLGGYPKRPFFTQSIPRARKLAANAVAPLFGMEFLGRIKNTGRTSSANLSGVENAWQHRLQALALSLAKTVQAEIDSGGNPKFDELRKRTLAEKRRKGYPDDILIETKQLRNKIQWAIFSPKAFGKNRIVIGNADDDVMNQAAAEIKEKRKKNR